MPRAHAHALVVLGLLACSDASPPPAPATPSQPVVTSWPGQSPTPSPVADQRPAAGSPRELADAAFNQAMRAHELGPAIDAARLIPEALAAYERVPSLDPDGLFHVATLQEAGGLRPAAIATAEQVLEQHPTHLLALGIAGRAAIASADVAKAHGYYQRLVEAYEAEQGARAEYQHHAVLLPIYLEEAQRVLAAPLAP